MGFLDDPGQGDFVIRYGLSQVDNVFDLSQLRVQFKIKGGQIHTVVDFGQLKCAGLYQVVTGVT